MAAPVGSRFVVLRHETPVGAERASHWDLMLEAGGVLCTWALAQWPPRSAADDDESTCAAERLPDHRLHYLDYEGEISGGRGAVTRCEAGTYRAIDVSADRWDVELVGERLVGRAVLERRDQGWRFAFRKA